VNIGRSSIERAQQNHSPVLVLGGRSPAMRWGQGSLQEIDHVPFVRPLVKLAATAGATAEIPGLIDDAWAVMRRDHPGPAFLDFPLDVVFMEAEDSPLDIHAPTGAEPDARDIERIAAILREADRPVIMVGPGTGVAPYRAFLQERQATGARGRNWLFFGDRRFTHDFLYQLDWQELKAEGVLTRIDVAFSRDQPEKAYVQHRMWERRQELFAWLEEGAHLYVCGDEKRMAKDVHAVLHRIVAEAGGRSEDETVAYIAELKRQGRYQRDVY
jgi:hypothetical protein